MSKLQLVAIAAFSAKESAAVSSTSAAIGLNESVYTLENKSGYAQSVIYEPNTNYDPCLCDLTAQTCDAFCCCDTDCSFVSSSHNRVVRAAPPLLTSVDLSRLEYPRRLG